MTEPHESHQWATFNNPAMMCTACQVCTCHSPGISNEPCEYRKETDE